MTLALNFFFVPIRLSDVIEVAIVSFILYQLYRMMRGTIGMQVLLGLMALVILDNIVTAMNMRVLRALFSTIGEVFVLAIIILFQPEIRRALSLVFGQVPLISRLLTSPEQGRAAFPRRSKRVPSPVTLRNHGVDWSQGSRSRRKVEKRRIDPHGLGGSVDSASPAGPRWPAPCD